MAFGADTDVFPWIVQILRIDHIITEDVILNMLIVDRIHELPTVGTVDSWLAFVLRI